MKITVRLAEKNEIDIWEDLVDKSECSTIFHKFEFLKIIEKHTKLKLYTLIGFKGSKAIGILPIFFGRSNGIKTIFSPPPKTGIPTMGAVINYSDFRTNYDKEKVTQEFIKVSNDYIKNNLDPDYLSISCSYGLIDMRGFKWLDYNVTPAYSYILSLDIEKESMWANLKNDIRTDIRFSIKNKGTVVIEKNAESVKFVFDSVDLRYFDQGLVHPFSKQYVEDIVKKFPKNVKVFISKKKGTRTSGLLLLLFKDKAMHFMGATKNENRGITSQIMWESIMWAKKEGYKYFELMGGNTERLCKFKSKYNPQLVTSYVAEKHNLKGAIGKNIYKKLLKPIKTIIKNIRRH